MEGLVTQSRYSENYSNSPKLTTVATILTSKKGNWALTQQAVILESSP